MKRFSVLTVSRRTGWERLATACLYAQSVQPEQWIIVTDDAAREQAAFARVPPYPTTVILPEPPKRRPSNLNAALNEGLRHISSAYVIFYQDFIELPPDCFAKLLALATRRTFVTTCTPNYDGSDDGRYTHRDAPRACAPPEWEANVAIAPMAAIRELGGFDEAYDEGWSWDNVNLAERAALLDYKFLCDESNRPKLLPHDHPRGLRLNGDFHARTMAQIRAGEKPLCLPYLTGGQHESDRTKK